jgi:hypothetical protein
VYRFARIFGGWAFTLVMAGCLSAAIAAWGVYAPNKGFSNDAVYTSQVMADPLQPHAFGNLYRRGPMCGCV